MNPERSPLAHLRAAINADLERFTAPVTDALRALAASSPNPRARVLIFEYEYGVGQSTFPINYFALDAAMSSLNPTPTSSIQLPDVALFSERGGDALATQLPDISIEDEEFAAVAAWWRRCWLAADGPRFPLPAFIMMHDSVRGIDLATGEEHATRDIYP